MKLDDEQKGILHSKLMVLKSYYGVSCIVSICSECGLILGCKDGLGNCGLSHGLCQPCRDQELAEIIRTFKEKGVTA
jgi:hypothetical protein